MDIKHEFSRIYDQYLNRIYRFVFLRVNSLEIAQDIVSETFSRAWVKYSEIRNPKHEIRNWSAFLYQIARNLITDFYREKGKFQIVSASFPGSDPASTEDLEAKAILSSDMVQIRKALSRLGQEQQEMVIWRYLDGLSTKEIAEISGKPEGTVRVICHRALEAVRKQLNNEQLSNEQ